jgi:hypothetical protein
MLKRVNFNDGYTSEIVPSLSVPAGRSIYTGSIVPDNTLHNDGDIYLNSNGNVYLKIAGAWTLQYTLELDAETIASIPTGDLESTNVQDALNELQLHLNDKATVAQLENHVADAIDTHSNSTSTHGVAGHLVGDSDAQTLSNKTITAPEINGGLISGPSIVNAAIESPTRSDVKQGTKASLISYAASTTNSQVVFASDEKKMYQIIDGALKPLGGGSSSLSTIFQLLGEEAITDWSSGNNVNVLGGGSRAGSFVLNSVQALQNSQDYKFTQAAGSLNDYLLSPVQIVDPRFRGQNATLFFPFKYDGSNNDIEVVFYDATNLSVIPSSVFLQNSPTVSIFRTNILIPQTCAGIRVGFQVKVANTGKVFEFDSVQLSSDTTVYADIANQTQSSFRNQALSFGAVTITGTASVSEGGGLFTYNSTTGLYTVLKNCDVNVSAGFSTSAATSVQPVITSSLLGDMNVANTISVIGSWGVASAAWLAKAGETFYIRNGGNTTNAQKITVVAKASSQNILTAPDTFSTDTASLSFSSTYNLATLPNAPIGTYITYILTAGGNTRTQTTGTNRPAQSDADMNQNGILIYTRAYNVTSTAAQPSCFAIQIGKGFKGRTLDIYKAVGKTIAGGMDAMVCNTTVENGILIKDYNETTGVLLIDAGSRAVATTTTANIVFSDATPQTFGYLVVNASRNPALTGLNLARVSFSGASTSGQSIPAGGDVNFIPDTVDFNSKAVVNSTTGEITGLEPGDYILGGQITINSNTYIVQQSMYVLSRVNGINQKSIGNAGAQTASAIILSATLSGLVRINSTTDILTFRVFSSRSAGPIVMSNNPSNNYITLTKANIG